MDQETKTSACLILLLRRNFPEYSSSETLESTVVGLLSLFMNMILSYNAIVSHIHQRNGVFDHNVLIGYSCTDHLGWAEAFYAEKVHRKFIQDANTSNIGQWRRSFSRWICYSYERVSINAISWLGEDMAKLGGAVEVHEELSLSSWIPERLKRPCEIFGGAIAAHFAFGPQRPILEKTNILQIYDSMAERGWCLPSLSQSQELK